MLKRVLSFIMGITLIFSMICVSGAELNTSYWPGETHHTVDKNDCIETDNAEILSDGVKINQGGSAVYGFYIPYNSRSLKLVHTGTGSLVIETGENRYDIALDASGETLLEFGKYFGYSPQNYILNGNSNSYAKREYVEHSGERTIKLSASGDVTIHQMLFEKEKTITVSKGYLPGVSNEIMESMSTVMIDADAPVIVVNGSTRYIDYDNTDTKPYELGGSLYLPVDTLAKALGYYHEWDFKKGYVLMRSETHEVVLHGTKCTVSEGLTPPVDAPENVIVFNNGKAYGAVRYFGELNGETVGYKDGLVVIDNKYTVNDILEQEGFYTFARNKFKDFKGEKIAGKTYHVAQTENANDNNPGSEEAPFLTLAKAGNIAKAGDTVIIHQGTYRETLTPQNSGTASAPITFRAAENEKVVISAADVLGTPTLYKDNVYVAAMPVDMGDGRNQIFIDGEMQTEARYPNGPGLVRKEGMLDNAWPVRGNLYRPVGSADKVKSDTLLFQEDDYWVGGTYVGLFGLAYTQCTAKIIDSTSGELTLAAVKGKDVANKFYWTPTSSDHYNWGYIVGHENALDAPGEWIRTNASGGTVKFILPEGKSANDITVEAKARQLVIDLADKNYINIEGIETLAGSARMNNSKMCMLNRMNMRYIAHYTHSADQRDGYIDFPIIAKNPSGAPQRGEVGIFISGTDNVVANSIIDHSAGAGIYLTGSYTQIDNNILNDCGYMGSYVSGIHADTVHGESVTKQKGGFGVYNNTIYNCGRSAVNLSTMDDGSYYWAPWLASEFAYNDFHNTILTSADTGVFYNYHNNHGWDYQMTKVHHNFVYQETIKEDYNPYSFGLYLDGSSYGFDVSDNIVFYTEEQSGFSSNYVYEQTYDLSPASVRIWGNNSIGYIPGGIDGMKDEYFTEDKPFFAGSKLKSDKYNMNYDRVANNEYIVESNALNAVYSDGVTVNPEDGYADFTENGQYICFRDVDFGDGANELSLKIKGNSHWTQDKIQVMIGSLDAAPIDRVVKINTREKEQAESLRLPISKHYGKKDVYVKVVDYKSVRIGGVSAYLHANDWKTEEYAHYAYASEFASTETWAKPVDTNLARSEGTIRSNPLTPAIKDTWPGNSLIYADQVIEADADTFVIAIGSSGQYADQPIEVYIDDEKQPIVTLTRTNSSFDDFSPICIPLSRILKAGTYDITLKFPPKIEADGKENWNKSSNIMFFGFVKEGASLRNIAPLAKKYGSLYNAEESVQNSEQPFNTIYMDPPNYDMKGLMYTLPGTVAVYDDVYLRGECTDFAVRYAADSEFDGQTVEVRIGSASSEPVATFTTNGEGVDVFKTEYVKLDAPIAPGSYKVYLNFGGTKGGRQTCKLAWFGFTK